MNEFSFETGRRLFNGNRLDPGLQIHSFTPGIISARVRAALIRAPRLGFGLI